MGPRAESSGMPEIEVSEEQYAYVEALRDELADEVTYGHVRIQDAFQYLIDQHRAESDPDVSVDMDAIDADEIEPDGGDRTDGGGTASETGADGDDAGEEASSSVDGAVEALNSAGPGGGTAGDPDPSQGDHGADTIDGAGDDTVDRMMNLLEEHDDKWTQTDGSDGKYSVELPDGTTESAQTKDDVRAVLFKHYN